MERRGNELGRCWTGSHADVEHVEHAAHVLGGGFVAGRCSDTILIGKPTPLVAHGTANKQGGGTVENI
jgi:hypothetical protein